MSTRYEGPTEVGMRFKWVAAGTKFTVSVKSIGDGKIKWAEPFGWDYEDGVRSGVYYAPEAAKPATTVMRQCAGIRRPTSASTDHCQLDAGHDGPHEWPGRTLPEAPKPKRCASRECKTREAPLSLRHILGGTNVMAYVCDPCYLREEARTEWRQRGDDDNDRIAPQPPARLGTVPQVVSVGVGIWASRGMRGGR